MTWFQNMSNDAAGCHHASIIVCNGFHTVSYLSLNHTKRASVLWHQWNSKVQKITDFGHFYYQAVLSMNKGHCILGAKRHFHFGASPKLFSVTNKILLVTPFRTVQFYPLPDPTVPPRDSSVRCLAHIGQCLTPQPLIAGLPDFDCVMCIYE